jgi:transcriptional regulator with XRE-family HTH domain
MSQAGLADLVGRSASAVRSWERGSSTPTDESIVRSLAAILGIDEGVLRESAGLPPESWDEDRDEIGGPGLEAFGDDPSDAGEISWEDVAASVVRSATSAPPVEETGADDPGLDGTGEEPAEHLEVEGEPAGDPPIAPAAALLLDDDLEMVTTEQAPTEARDEHRTGIDDTAPTSTEPTSVDLPAGTSEETIPAGATRGDLLDELPDETLPADEPAAGEPDEPLSPDEPEGGEPDEAMVATVLQADIPQKETEPFSPPAAAGRLASAATVVTARTSTMPATEPPQTQTRSYLDDPDQMITYWIRTALTVAFAMFLLVVLFWALGKLGDSVGELWDLIKAGA